eukprot:scaffold261741_cov28-Tisochrysis_lutea.AAC.2
MQEPDLRHRAWTQHLCSRLHGHFVEKAASVFDDTLYRWLVSSRAKEYSPALPVLIALERT